MQIATGVSDVARADRRRDKIARNAIDVRFCHRPWYLPQAAAECNGRGCDGLPAARVALGDMIVAFPRAVGAGLAAGMPDLDPCNRTGLFDAGDDRR